MPEIVLAPGEVLLTRAQAKPCPFCGHQPTIQPWHGGGPRKRLIACSSEACVVSAQVCGATTQRALDNWNYRFDE